MAYNQKSNISKYTLYVARGYSINKSAFSAGPEKEYKKVMESDKSSTALVTHVKQIYKGNPTKFAQDYQEICSKFMVEELDDIDHLIKVELGLPLHSSAPDIGNTYFEKRVNELFTRVCARIMDCAGRRIPYVCIYPEYMQLCEEICKNISPTQCTPDYESFRQVYAQTDLTEDIRSSREYRQLLYCELPKAEILEHLSWEQYYQHIRQLLLTDAKKETIAKTERIARQNHRDVVHELKADGHDTPILRLIKTKKSDISTLRSC